MRRQKIIALCGSGRFKKEILQEQERLMLAGNMVIAPVIFDCNTAPDDVENLILQKIRYQKIEMADEILVINKYNYIEESTRLEIQYAICLKKPVTYLYKRFNLYERIA